MHVTIPISSGPLPQQQPQQEATAAGDSEIVEKVRELFIALKEHAGSTRLRQGVEKIEVEWPTEGSYSSSRPPIRLEVEYKVEEKKVRKDVPFVLHYLAVNGEELWDSDWPFRSPDGPLWRMAFIHEGQKVILVALVVLVKVAV